MQSSYFIKKYGNCDKHNELIDKIMKSSVISFDIFDTLLVRTVLEPSDLFFFMEREIRNILGEERSLMFRKLRPNIEEKVRNKIIKNNIEEITFDQIYEELQLNYNISKDKIDKIKKLELDFEEKMLYPREYVKDIYNLSLKLGKKIIIISDMYLSKKYLKEILIKNNFNTFQNIFISSEYKLTKYKGSLYSKVISDLKVKPESILHIGDNYYSDVEQARKHNIQTFYVPKVKEVAFKNVDYISKLITNSYVDKSVLALLINKRFSCPYYNEKPSLLDGDFYNFGYMIYGPMIFSLVLNIIRECKQRNIKKMIFFERDGFIVKKAFDKMKVFLDEDQIKSESLFINRNIVTYLSINKYPEIFNRYNYKIYLVDVLKELIPSLDREAIIKIINNYGLKENVELSKVDNCIVNKILVENLINLEKINYEYLNYLNNFFKEENLNKIGTFDVGYQGTSDMFLSMLIPEYKNSYHFYLSTISGGMYHNLDYTSFFDNLIFDNNVSYNSNVLFEINLSNVMSQKQIAKENKLKYIYEYLKESLLEDLEIEKILKVQEGIICFIDDILNIYHHQIKDIDLSKSFILSLLRYQGNADSKDRLYFAFHDNSKKNIISLTSPKLKATCKDNINKSPYKGYKRFFKLLYYKSKYNKFFNKKV